MAVDTSTAMAALDSAQKAVDAAKIAQSATQPWTSDLVRFLATSVLVFCAGALVLATILLWRTGAQPPQVLRLFGIISILGFSALLLVTGYSNEQLTPIVGLFGAIAGYLLGKDANSSIDK